MQLQCNILQDLVIIIFLFTDWLSRDREYSFVEGWYIYFFLVFFFSSFSFLDFFFQICLKKQMDTLPLTSFGVKNICAPFVKSNDLCQHLQLW